MLESHELRTYNRVTVFWVCVCPPAATRVGRVIVLLREYGKDFSGPGEDVFRSGRATGRPEKSHTSNFLHPVFYYYQRLPTGGVRARPAAPVRHMLILCLLISQTG